MPVECDQRVGVELSQCDVLGVEGIGPAEHDRGFPCDVLQDAVPEQTDPQPATENDNITTRRNTNDPAACQ